MSPDGSAARTITTGTDAVWSPAGDRIAFARDGAILAADADGSNEAVVSAIANVASGSPQWLNADQTKALASNGICDRITTQDGQHIRGSDGDTLYGGPGDDTIDAREGRAEGDIVDCGAGRHDVAYVGRFDAVRNCERVIRR